MHDHDLHSYNHKWVPINKIRFSLSFDKFIKYNFFSNRFKALRPIYVANTTVDYEGWIRVNFTEMLNGWLVKTRQNNLLYITIAYQNIHGILESSSVDTNYLLSFWEEERQPFVSKKNSFNFYKSLLNVYFIINFFSR